MCGIFGILGAIPAGPGAMEPDTLSCMSRLLRHRGPDDEGFVLFGDGVTEACGDETITERQTLLPVTEAFNRCHPYLAFGHRRLAIIDVSAAGHQPMTTPDHNLWITYNGEIYNYRELRAELQANGYQFRSRTDTEVVLAAYAAWGIAGLNRLSGMFAFAIHDCRTRETLLVRDRYGIKPLYYLDTGSRLVFASEIKAIQAAEKLTIDPLSVFGFLTNGTSPAAPRTFFEQVKLLEPGHYVRITAEGIRSQHRWYSLTPPSRELAPLDESFAPQTREFVSIFSAATRAHLVADVPVGFCLSGGTDSSAIVSAVAKGGWFRDLMHTFSAVFPGQEMDETEWMDVVIADTGVNQHKVEPQAEGLLTELADICWHQDEPCHDETVYVEWCVMRLVREAGIVVALNGHGADELLSGYWQGIIRFLQQVRRQYGHEIYLKQRELFRKNNIISNELLPDPLSTPAPTVREPGVLMLNDEFYRHYRAVQPPALAMTEYLNEELIRQFFLTSLPRQLLWADKSSMAFSIECRVPYMDPAVVEYAFQQPGNFKNHNGWSKWPLRFGLEGILPDRIRWRTSKWGYAAPTQAWLPVQKPGLLKIIQEQRQRLAPYIDYQRLSAGFERISVPDETSRLFRIASLGKFIERFGL